MKNIEKDISLSIKEILSKFENDTSKYLNCFDIQSQIIFSDNEESKNKLLRNYKRFLIVIRNHTEALDSIIAKLSSQICASDNQCKKELTERLIKIFDNYQIFQSAVIKFMNNCDSAFLDNENGFHQSQIINYSRELFVAIKNFNQSI